jgi:hypothetical protein
MLSPPNSKDVRGPLYERCVKWLIFPEVPPDATYTTSFSKERPWR